MDNNILNQLRDGINNAKELKIKYGITGQEINKEDFNKLITFSSNTTMQVNYINKTAFMETVIGSFKGVEKHQSEFKDNNEVILKNDKNSTDNSFHTVEFSVDDYNKLFKPGGRLYPIEAEELIPVDSQINNTNCQVCVPSKKLSDNISGFVESTYTILKKRDNLYDITMMMKLRDEITQIELIQYCNTVIEIIL